MRNIQLCNRTGLALIGVLSLIVCITYEETPSYDANCLNKIALIHCLENNCEVTEIHKGKEHFPTTDIFDFNTRTNGFIRYSDKELEGCKIK